MPLKEEFVPYVSREKRACPARRGHVEKDQSWSGGERSEKEEHDPELLLGFSWEAVGEAG